MKRFLCVLLSAALLLGVSAPSFAAQTEGEPVYVDIDGRSPIPIIYISGDGDALYTAEGKQALHWRSLLDSFTSDDEENSENIKQSVMNIVYPFLVEGVLTNKWDNYYSALQKEITDIFGDSLLDNNGEASNGTDIARSRYNSNAYNMRTDKKVNGTYGFDDYRFWYDWRLDPLESADAFNEYVKGIKAATNSEKVGICCSCLGTSVIMAYIAKYGMGDIQGVGFNAGTVNGMETISQTISGKFKLDPEAINRFLTDCDSLGLIGVDSFITASIDLLDKNGVFDLAVGVTRATVYDKLVEGVTSALALSTLYTWPSYWASVTSEDYDDALRYVFGKAGSEKRAEYAKLIEKIENYNTAVRKNLPDLFKSIADNGNIGVVSKYGYQIIPVCEARDEIGDQLGSVYRTSYGATTAKVYDTLSDKYIASKISEGNGKYISPDKKIDASTCQFPDNTWFVKGSSHSNWTSVERHMLMEIASADRQLTVDDFTYSQYMVWDNETLTMSRMTQENCDTENWTADKPVEKRNIFKRMLSFIKSFMNWLKEAISLIQEKRAAQQTTGQA